jgi:hypothetical protein
MVALLNKRIFFFAFLVYWILSCSEPSLHKNQADINNRIELIIDTCFFSKYDTHKYIIELTVFNKSNDTIYIENPKRSLSLVLREDIDSVSDAFLLLDRSSINLIKKTWEGGFIDYFPETLFSDSHYIYKKYFDSIYEQNDYNIVYPSNTKKVTYVLSINVYDRLEIKQEEAKNLKDFPSLVLKLKSYTNKDSSWDYLYIPNGQNVFNTLLLDH